MTVKPARTSNSAWARMSPRERTLVGVAVALSAVIAAVYLGVLPGLDAARSAESRRDRAAAELVAVRNLAAEAAALSNAAATAPEGDAMAAVGALAADAGLQLSELTNAGAPTNDIVARVSAPSSAAILRWVSAVQSQTGIGARTFSLSAAPADGVIATVTFAGNQP